MKAALVGLILVALAAGAPQSPGSADQSSAVRELERIEHQLAEAWLKGDRKFVEGILADDWTVTDASGHVLTKRQVIDEGFATHERRITSAVFDELRVRIYGDTAVVIGRSNVSGEYRGKSAHVVARFMDVFVRRGKSWQVVASQATRLPE